MDRDSAVALAQQAILRSNCRLIDAVERAQAAARLEALLARTEPEAPGLLSLHPGVDLNCADSLTRAFAGCSGVVLYTTANTSSAGRITNHGNDPRGGRAVVMRQVMAALAALRANPSVQQVITLIFPTDKVTGIADPDFMVNWTCATSASGSAPASTIRTSSATRTCIWPPAHTQAMSSSRLPSAAIATARASAIGNFRCG